MISIKFKDAMVEVEYESSWDDIEIVNVFYNGMNVNELLDDADNLAIYEQILDVLEDQAADAEIDRICD